MSKKLFDQSDDSDNDLQLGTNTEYVKSYNNFRKKELLKKFKDRGEDISDLDSSSDESSGESEVLDPKFDEEFFKTLSSLKSKDPTIYDKQTQFFEGLKDEPEAAEKDDENNVDRIKEKKVKPVTLKDYERNIILERNGIFEDDSSIDAGNDIKRPSSPTIVDEERYLKEEFSKVLNDDSMSDDEEEFGGIFKKREKSKADRDKEEDDFRHWLSGKKDHIDSELKEKLEPLKNYWHSNKLPQREQYLRDYILNNGYAHANSSDIPTYDEVVNGGDVLSEDEKELEKQETFEHKYNFRFDEPDSAFLKRYPRTIDNSVRRTDDKRKQKRQELKQRKQHEKEQKLNELEMIKEMKRKEIEEKIQKLKMVTGNDELGFKLDELDEDFDPEEHDRRMQEIFNEDYYQIDEGEEKPECPSDIEELKVEDWDNYDPKVNAGNNTDPHCEDDDFNMDCDYDPAAASQQFQKELIENTKGRRTRRGRKNRFMEMIQAEKPPFNPEDEKTYAEYIDEYYKMDCEDIIGDIPCRFKYVETTPNDFGLTIEEILLAKNKELNQWASLKKAIQIRPEHIEKKDQKLYKMKSKNEDLKRKIFKSLYGDESDGDEEEMAGSSHVKQQNVENGHKNIKKSNKGEKRGIETQTTHDGNLEESAKSLDIPEASRKKAKLQTHHTNTPKSSVENHNVSTDKKDVGVEVAKVKTQVKEDAVKSPKKLNPFKKNNQIGNGFERKNTNNIVKKKQFKSKFVNKKQRSNSRFSEGMESTQISDMRLKAYGINPKKLHKKQKYGNKK